MKRDSFHYWFAVCAEDDEYSSWDNGAETFADALQLCYQSEVPCYIAVIRDYDYLFEKPLDPFCVEKVHLDAFVYGLTYWSEDYGKECVSL